MYFIGYMFIYAACGLYRNEEGKIKFETREWLIKSLLVIIGGTILVESALYYN